MQSDRCTSRMPFIMTEGQRFSREHRERFSLVLGFDEGKSVIAMVTVERRGSQLEWEALIWRGTTVWVEMSGMSGMSIDVPGAIEAHIKQRLSGLPTRSVAPRQSRRAASGIYHAAVD